MKPIAVISCIAIVASDCTSDYKIHIFNKGFDAYRHGLSIFINANFGKLPDISDTNMPFSNTTLIRLEQVENTKTGSNNTIIMYNNVSYYGLSSLSAWSSDFENKR